MPSIISALADNDSKINVSDKLSFFTSLIYHYYFVQKMPIAHLSEKSVS